MEHSILHALQLSGAVVALGGAILMLAFVYPVLKPDGRKQMTFGLASELESSVVRWMLRCGVLGIVAALLNILVDVSEIDGRTIFGELKPALVWRFITSTTVGHLSLLRIGALVFTVAATRISARWKWGPILAGALAAVFCEALICHAAAQPNGRISAIALELVHVVAASLWIGVLVHLLLARPAIMAATENSNISLLAAIVSRFSPVALTSVGLLAVSGLILTTRYLVTPLAVPTSAYGLTLLVKLGLLVPLLYAGYVN